MRKITPLAATEARYAAPLMRYATIMALSIS